MTTVQAKDPFLRGVSPTPSKIPLRCQRRPPRPTDKTCAQDQENEDPRRLVQKPTLSIQHPPTGRTEPSWKASYQTEKSLGSTQQHNPLKELRARPGGQNMGPGPPSLKEAPGTVEFVADPAALATILSGEGVKSCRLGRPPSLAQRVLVRENQRSALRRGQGARASAYMAPRTPKYRLDPARASCFSRLEGPGPRGRTLCLQRLETLGHIPPSGTSFHSSTRPSFLELRRVTGGSNRTSVNQASGLLQETPTQPASSLSDGEHEAVTHSHEGRGDRLSLAQRIPLKETHTEPTPGCGRVVLPSVTRLSPFGLAQRVVSLHPPALTSYSVLRRLAVRPKTQFTPIQSASSVQKGHRVSGVSPPSCPEPEEPFLPWEQIAVQLFDQESSVGLQEEPEIPSEAPHGPLTNSTPNLQELKMQRISILQQLLRQEMEGLARDKQTTINGGSSLDTTELHPLLTEISRTLNAPERNSKISHLPGLFQHSELPKPCLTEEGPQPFLAAEPGVSDPCYGRESEIPEPAPQQELGVPESCIPAETVPLQHSPSGETGLPQSHPRVETSTSENSPMELRNPQSIEEPHKSPCAPVSTSLIVSSQPPPCASPPVQSLRPPAGRSGPSSLAPRTLALRQRLKACMTAIHCFREACLDDECAFYTSRVPSSAPPRVCANPVATLLEWQDALCFIPICSAAAEGSPS
ncbi:PREDICTED: tastin [Elephantulus edwardii]|uniref:tastin n=1 Tax=Elephantulus edwardii TaxID=28737 RepID=UPI0003F0E8FE|nr:PREDICTED: tastin [Elephantulus edwardii]